MIFRTFHFPAGFFSLDFILWTRGLVCSGIQIPLPEIEMPPEKEVDDEDTCARRLASLSESCAHTADSRAIPAE